MYTCHLSAGQLSRIHRGNMVSHFYMIVLNVDQVILPYLQFKHVRNFIDPIIYISHFNSSQSCHCLKNNWQLWICSKIKIWPKLEWNGCYLLRCFVHSCWNSYLFVKYAESIFFNFPPCGSAFIEICKLACLSFKIGCHNHV